jgi:hypothetical protein
MDALIKKFLVRLAQMFGVPVALYEVWVIAVSGTNEMGSALVVLGITVGVEMYLYALSFKWFGSNISSPSFSKLSKGGRDN